MSQATDSPAGRTDETSFITTSGGLLTEQLVRKLRGERPGEDAVAPQTFAHNGVMVDSPEALEAEISTAWEALKERWDDLSQRNEIYGFDTSTVRSRWLLPLFETLGFDPVYQQQHLEADGITADLSHLGWDDSAFSEGDAGHPPVLHLVEPDKDEQLDSGQHPGAATRTPHDELQRYLNAADQQWSVVSDGLQLRLLRDFFHTYTRGYVEFDLENIFTERNYGDFRALYRLCHASRFTPVETADDEPTTRIEQLYQVAIATGIKIGQDLQGNVIRALEALGNGFLDTAPELRSELQDGDASLDDFYQDLLFVVYRLLFLLYAEQRDMIAPRDSLYATEYAVTRLRERSLDRDDTHDANTDLWHGLEATFALVEDGNEELGVPCYNGMLFDDAKFTHIADVACTNDALLDAIEALTIIHRDGVPQRVSYADLGVEELGSVYESLLELSPDVADDVEDVAEIDYLSVGDFYLGSEGTERKETGSYYTDPGLVHELIKSSLDPQIETRVSDADGAEAQVDALLDLDVCDPACGSAAFLVAANNRIAQRIAEIRTGEEYPPAEAIRTARRDVLQRCIYGVDLNPMAVELAKVSLWINSAVRDKPLNFLDHHIKCGNALVGVGANEIEGQFPEDAYETSKGREWHDGNEVRKQVRRENKARDAGPQATSLSEYDDSNTGLLDLATSIEAHAETDSNDVRKKKRAYSELKSSTAYQYRKAIYDVWTAAFYWPMDGSGGEYPSPSTIEKLRRTPDPDRGELRETKNTAHQIAQEQGFFHWEIEFPDVFLDNSRGFDCIIGNPPWDKIKLEEQKWFKGKDNRIASSNSKRERNSRINELRDADSELIRQWDHERLRVSQMSKFIRNSERYNLTAKGELNTYPIFTELCSESLIDSSGRVGLVVKTGIATDKGNADYFGHLVEQSRIVSLFDFENTERIFSDVEENERFCALTINGQDRESMEAQFSFFNKSVEDSRNGSRRFTLSPSQIEKINPNTKTCPTFATTTDRDITLDIYDKVQVLVNDTDKTNPWGIEYQTMYHMSNDSSVFEDNTKAALEDRGFELDTQSIFKGENTQYVPLWEGKLIHQLDHRFATFEGISEDKKYGRKAPTNNPSSVQKADPEYEIEPRYWVAKDDVTSEQQNRNIENEWMFIFRDIARSHTDVRTSVGTIVPAYAAGNKAPILTFENDDPRLPVVFSSVFTSFIFDYALRQSLGGATVNLYILKQLPMPSPSALKKTSIRYDGNEEKLFEFLLDRALKLMWTSHALDPLGRDLDVGDGPYNWDTSTRRQLRAEIDAALAVYWGLSKEDLTHIIDSFDILRRRETDEYGEYLTRSCTVDCFERLVDLTNRGR